MHSTPPALGHFRARRGPQRASVCCHSHDKWLAASRCRRRALAPRRRSHPSAASGKRRCHLRCRRSARCSPRGHLCHLPQLGSETVHSARLDRCRRPSAAPASAHRLDHHKWRAQAQSAHRPVRCSPRQPECQGRRCPSQPRSAAAPPVVRALSVAPPPCSLCGRRCLHHRASRPVRSPPPPRHSCPSRQRSARRHRCHRRRRVSQPEVRLLAARPRWRRRGRRRARR